jgi:hypothetical protein
LLQCGKEGRNTHRRGVTDEKGRRRQDEVGEAVEMRKMEAVRSIRETSRSLFCFSFYQNKCLLNLSPLIFLNTCHSSKE